MIDAALIARGLKLVLPDLAYGVRVDVLEAFEQALDTAIHDREKRILNQLIDNARYAREHQLPGCQDTGTVWVMLEVGPDVAISSTCFTQINAVVAQAYQVGALRKSTVFDSVFCRENRGDNTPAFTEIHLREDFEPGYVELHVMLKGAGSDNASRLAMLNPSDGVEGIERLVCEVVQEKGINACPPLVVGVGVGATFDTVAHLSKQALLRAVGVPAVTPEQAALEERLLTAVNALGIGAAGLGGLHTALAVHVETAPCHIAALPVAVNLGCSAMRAATIAIQDGEILGIKDPQSGHIASSLAELQSPQPVIKQATQTFVTQEQHS